MNKIKSNLKYVVFAVLIIAIMAMQFQINMYFDDYGDLSLSYGWDGNTKGMSYTVLDVLKFCKNLYFNWTGRLATTFIAESAFSIGGWHVIQLMNGLAIILICISAGVIVSDYVEIDIIKAVDISLLLFGLYSITTLQASFYWYAAFISYIWPMAPLLIALALVSHCKKTNTVLICVLIFLCGFSDEQYAAMLFVTVASLTIIEYIFNKKVSRQHIIYLVVTVLTTVLEISAPGNFARAGDSRYLEFYALPLWKRIARNFYILLDVNFGKHNIVFDIVLTASIAIYFFVKKNKNIWLGLGALGAAGLCVATRLADGGLSLYLKGAFMAGWFIVAFGLILYDIFIEKKYILLAVFLGAMSSQGMMLIIPAIPNRVHVPMEIILNMVIAGYIAYIWRAVAASSVNKVRKVVGAALIAGIAVYCIFNFSGTFVGYCRNMDIHRLNHYKLTEASRNYKEGLDCREVRLYKLIDDNYAGAMPYNSDSYMESWMRNFYELPQYTEFFWCNFGEDFSYSVKSGDYWEDRWLGETAILQFDSNVDKTVELTFGNAMGLENQHVTVEAGEEKKEIDVAGEVSCRIKIPAGSTDVVIHASKTGKEPGARDLSVVMQVMFK